MHLRIKATLALEEEGGHTRTHTHTHTHTLTHTHTHTHTHISRRDPALLYEVLHCLLQTLLFTTDSTVYYRLHCLLQTPLAMSVLLTLLDFTDLDHEIAALLYEVLGDGP
jgi:hypothetical protein